MKLMWWIFLPFQGAGAIGAAGKSKDAVNATKTNAYGVINKFLAGFIDHVRDIRSKLLYTSLSKWVVCNDRGCPSFSVHLSLIRFLYHRIELNETFTEFLLHVPMCTYYFRFWSESVWGFTYKNKTLSFVNMGTWRDPSVIPYSSYTTVWNWIKLSQNLYYIVILCTSYLSFSFKSLWR